MIKKPWQPAGCAIFGKGATGCRRGGPYPRTINAPWQPGTYLSWLLIATLFASTGTAAQDSAPRQDGSGGAPIVFEGKLFCPLNRPVIMPFPGIVTDLRIAPGQRVKKGELLCQYSLDKGKAIEIGRELLFHEIDELRGNIASTEFKLTTLEKNEKELTKLTADKLSPQSALDSLHNELRLTRAYLTLLKKQFSNARLFADSTLQHFRELLGDNALASGHIPDIVSVRAPISGIILNLHPLLRKDSLLPEGTILTQIGTMDTMSVRSLVYERDVVHLTPGMTVRFFPDSLPGKVFPATVATIDRTPNTSSPDTPSYYQIEMTIKNDQLELREGFKGRVECTAPTN